MLSPVEAEPRSIGFRDLGLSKITLAALHEVAYVTPSPVQAALIPIAITGKDCIGQARTGTGKTAAFVIPILEQLDFDNPATQALVLAPTRELSQQVADEALRLAAGRPVEPVCCVGGRPIRKQMSDLKHSAQFVIGTPGRVIDLLMRRVLKFNELKIVVLDEADRMLDIGFRPDIEKILRQCPTQRQTLLLSATLPAPVERLARKFMIDPERVDLSTDCVATDTIEQFYVSVDPQHKFQALVKLLAKERPRQAIVFTRTKRRAEEVYRHFAGRLPNIAFLHGDLAQPVRDSVLQSFRDGKLRLLIATDVVGRGIDISGISHIINYDIPEYCDDYVHRIGRTGRLSSEDEKGYAFTFVSGDEGDQLTNVEKRVNTLLQQYEIDGVYSPRPPRQHVEATAGQQFSVA